MARYLGPPRLLASLSTLWFLWPVDRPWNFSWRGLYWPRAAVHSPLHGAASEAQQALTSRAPSGDPKESDPASCGPGAKKAPGLKSWAPGMVLAAVLGVDVWGRAWHLQCRGRRTLALAQSRSGSGAFTMTCLCQQMPRRHSWAESSLMAAWPCPPVLGTSHVTACGGLVGHVL